MFANLTDTVEIAALSETRLAEEGLLKEVGACYTFFWSGRKKGERREAGVGFAIKSHILSKLSGLPKGINDRLMMLRQEACNNCKCLCTHNDQPRWGSRQGLWWSGFCDFCSTVDRQTHPPWELQCQSGHRPPTLGMSEWIWRCREVQQQCTPPFKEVCRAWITDHQHSLLSTNSQKDIMDAPLLQTLASHWLCHSAKDVRVTKTMCGADCWTDHRLVVSKLNLRIQPVRRPQGKKMPKKLDVSKLKQDSKRQTFVNDLCSHLDALEHSSEDVDESWTVFRDTVHSSTIHSWTNFSQTPRLVWWEWQRNPGTPWRETPKTQGLPQKYQLSI